MAARARCSWSRSRSTASPRRHGNGATIGFAFDSPEEVDAWHQRGIAAGGTAIEDPPGIRAQRVRFALPRLSARSRRQQIVRAASPGAMTIETVSEVAATAGCRASIAMPPPRPAPTWCFRCSCRRGRARRAAAGAVVSVGADLQPRQRHRKRRVSRCLRRGGDDLHRPRHQPARGGRARRSRGGL